MAIGRHCEQYLGDDAKKRHFMSWKSRHLMGGVLVVGDARPEGDLKLRLNYYYLSGLAHHPDSFSLPSLFPR